MPSLANEWLNTPEVAVSVAEPSPKSISYDTTGPEPRAGVAVKVDGASAVPMAGSAARLGIGGGGSTVTVPKVVLASPAAVATVRVTM